MRETFLKNGVEDKIENFQMNGRYNREPK